MVEGALNAFPFRAAIESHKKSVSLIVNNALRTAASAVQTHHRHRRNRPRQRRRIRTPHPLRSPQISRRHFIRSGRLARHHPARPPRLDLLRHHRQTPRNPRPPHSKSLRHALLRQTPPLLLPRRQMGHARQPAILRHLANPPHLRQPQADFQRPRAGSHHMNSIKFPDSSKTAAQDSITVEYALTRREILYYFVRATARSARLFSPLLLFAVVAGIANLITRGVSLHSLQPSDFASAAAWALGALVFMAAWIFIRGKTSTRTLTISPTGIYTEIGKLRSETPWQKVIEVNDGSRFVLISCSNRNSYFIPERAFATTADRTTFVSAAQSWVAEPAIPSSVA